MDKYIAYCHSRGQIVAMKVEPPELTEMLRVLAPCVLTEANHPLTAILGVVQNGQLLIEPISYWQIESDQKKGGNKRRIDIFSPETGLLMGWCEKCLTRPVGKVERVSIGTLRS